MREAKRARVAATVDKVPVTRFEPPLSAATGVSLFQGTVCG